jgi:hypothetical protein
MPSPKENTTNVSPKRQLEEVSMPNTPVVISL